MTTEELQRLLQLQARRSAVNDSLSVDNATQSTRYERGFLDGAKLMMPLVAALEFECGNRCAPQNPCSAREALEIFKKELGTWLNKSI